MDEVCRGECRNFAKGRMGGANMGFFLKMRGQLQAVSGGALEDNI